MWQDPQATSYMALSLANMATSGIPPGFDVITGALYEKDTAQVYDKILSASSGGPARRPPSPEPVDDGLRPEASRLEAGGTCSRRPARDRSSSAK